MMERCEMTEPKYVKIPVEVRDKWISGELGTAEFISALRAAPSVEILDLNKVERWDLSADWDRDRTGKTEAWVRDRKSDAGEWVRFSDLQNLTKPEQSGGVEEVLSRIYRLVSEVVANPADNDMETFVAIMTEIEALQPPTPPMQASEARGVDLSRAVSGELSRYITNGEDLFHATQSVIPHLQQSPQGIGCGEYKIPGLDGTMWKCGGKPSSANGKTVLCDDCFSTIEKWGTQQPPQGVDVPTVGSRTFVVKNGALYETTMGIWCRIFEAKNLNGEDSIFTLQSPVKMTIQPPKDKP